MFIVLIASTSDASYFQHFSTSHQDETSYFPPPSVSYFDDGPHSSYSHENDEFQYLNKEIKNAEIQHKNNS